ncbi:ABC transporter permease [Duganella sp. Leaf126]|uniref:MlaE family ABC transporter permease n=1 Tax=Duganella sp. Leaf126 TaxID=1736266 RepID=UPI0006F3DE58|nr:ABC transporter permease [Duganella sp. Leaf126]KQQ39966.1 ABC transporter permease [Duganella sp. Leaf126]
MNALPSHSGIAHRLHRSAVSWLLSWWRLLNFSVLMLTIAVLPATYRKDNRRLLAQHLVRDTAPNLAWFGVLSALVSLVLIRIVLVTSQSYGLTRYALDLVVRVLTLELIPLTAAAFVALRTTLPAGLEFSQHRQRAAVATVAEMRSVFFPRVAAGIFAVWMLAAVSCVLTLVLAYLTLYGFTPYALPGYTRVVGQVFNPAVTMILALKIIFFSFAVGLIPMASSFYYRASYRAKVTHGLSDMVRLFAAILLIEIASLMGNYY